MADVRIAIDAMGGDHGPSVTVPATLASAMKNSKAIFTLVGDEVVLLEILAKQQSYPEVKDRIQVRHASQVVAMDEPPALSLRNKKDSSMRIALDMVKNGEVNACISAGNTGALMATARFVLKMIPGIDRPAICSALPAMQGHTHMMDLGANVDCTSEHLYQFAMMGSVLITAIDNIPEPRIGLLNIGEEEIKGNDQVKQANQLLKASGLNYIGYIEGDDIFGSSADLVVADGFVGNISIKSAEGIAHLFTDYMKKEFKRNLFTKLLGLIAYPVLSACKRSLDPRQYNGATLLGLQGIVIKSHGGADQIAFEHAIRIAVLEIKKDVIKHISERININ